MSRSWLDSETTRRKYKINSDPVTHWIVQNEYQRIKCPHCEQYLYGRLTRISEYNADHPDIAWEREIHLNYNANLDSLKKLLIAYPIKGSDQGLKEEVIEGEWKLIYTDRVFGEEIKV